MDSISVFCCTPSTASDSPLCAGGHDPDTGGRFGLVPTGLWELRTSRSSSLPSRRLQSVQNAAVRLIYNLRRSDHITDALASLHWLRILERVVFKVAVLIFKVLHGSAPEYLGPVIRIADLPGRQALRSSGTNRLVVPPFQLSTIGCRAFPVAGPLI